MIEKDNFQIRHKMMKGFLLIDMIDPWNKFELCLKPVSKYISEQLTRPQDSACFKLGRPL